MGDFIVPVIGAIYWLLDVYLWLIIASAIVSWLVAFGVINTYNRTVAVILDFLYRATDPPLRPIRRLLPNFGGLDISPLILIAIIWIIQGELAVVMVRLRAY